MADIYYRKCIGKNVWTYFLIKVHINIGICIAIVIFGISMAEDDIYVPDYYRWRHNDIATPDLLCPDCCKDGFIPRCPPFDILFIPDKATVCCTRNSIPYWKLYKYAYLQSYLHIYDEKCKGEALVNNSLAEFDSNVVNTTFYILNHPNGCFSSFPENLCNFPRIVRLSFSNNIIENITNINCLNILDTLDLSYNRLRIIRSSTFTNLPYLRYLFLSDNLITTLEPETFRYHPRSLMYVDLSYNRLVTLDITNIILGYYFRVVDYSHNVISNVTNTSKWKGLKDDQVGGGFFSLNHNNLTRWPDLKEYGFTKKNSLIRVGTTYFADYRNNPLICDCSAYLFISIGVEVDSYFKSKEGVKCMEPISLRGYDVLDFKNKELLHKLICNVSMKQYCPPKCSCFEQPSMNRVVVNCSLSDYIKMPKFLPKLNNLDIDLSKNRIQALQHFDYLKRTIKIDLSHNHIHEIDSAIFTIRKIGTINLYNNSMSSLDRYIQLKSPCKLQLGQVLLSQCTCAMNWMKIWLEKQNLLKCTENINMISCMNGDIQVNLTDLSENKLCPRITRNNMYVWFLVVTSVILVLFLLYYQFRYEIMLILRHYNIGYSSRCIDIHVNTVHDVYLSFNVDNNYVTTWVIRILVPHLESRGYKVCLPPRDFDIGGIHSEQILDRIGHAYSFLIILSEDYFQSQFQAIEWMNLWNVFKTDIDSKLVIINHDILKINDLKDRKLKACIRLGHSLDFSDFKNELLVEIEKRLRTKNSVKETSVYFSKNRLSFKKWEKCKAKKKELYMDVI